MKLLCLTSSRASLTITYVLFFDKIMLILRNYELPIFNSMIFEKVDDEFLCCMRIFIFRYYGWKQKETEPAQIYCCQVFLDEKNDKFQRFSAEVEHRGSGKSEGGEEKGGRSETRSSLFLVSVFHIFQRVWIFQLSIQLYTHCCV